MEYSSRLFKISILFIVSLLAVSFYVTAQQATNKRRGVEVEFINKKTKSISREVSSNVLRINNNSETPITFTLNISIPDGWENVAKRNNQYTIAKFDSLFIPVNLVPKKANEGNFNHIINASLIDDNDLQFSSAIWYMSTKMESNWNASIVSNKIFFLDDSDTSHFTLKFQNFGNSEEDIKISFAPDRRLKVFERKNRVTALRYYNLKLPINSDTSIVFNVEKAEPIQQVFREDLENTPFTKNDYSSVRITVQNERKDGELPKTWRTTANFIKAGTETRFNEYRSASLPLIIEANVDNFLDNSTILNINMYGSAELKNNRSLIYNYQTSFINNFYSSTPYFGNSQYIGYFTPKVGLELGDINGYANFGVSSGGRGSKINYQLNDNHVIGGFYLRGPGFFSESTKTDYGFNYELRRRSTSLENYIQFSDNTLLNTTGLQYSNKLKFLLARNQNLVISTAYSKETYNDLTVPVTKNGYAYLLNYYGNFNRLDVSLSNTYGTAYNIGYRGIKSGSAELTYKLSSSRNLGANAYFFQQNPQYFSSTGVLLQARQSSVQQYELKYTYNKPEYNAVFKYQHIYNEIFNLRSESNGLGFDFRPRPTGSLRFYLSVLGAYNKLLDYDIDPYFSAQMRTNLRYKGLSTNLRYNYGPYQTFEQLIFARTKENNQSIYTNTNLRLWLLKDVLTFEPSVVYSYETLYKRNRVSIRPEIYYIPKGSGLEVSFYGQYINNNQRNNPLLNLDSYREVMTPSTSSNLFFGFGIKKKIGVPISTKRYAKLSVLVFKDLNGNNKQDKNEPGLKNVLVNIKALKRDSLSYNSSSVGENGEHFITDGNGKISYKNLPKGEYLVKIIPLTENAGFFAGNEQVVKIEKDKDLLMPLNDGVRLTGSLVAKKDPNSVTYNQKEDLSMIRVTAIDSLGKVYSTLTGQNGNFSLKMPAGIYQVTLNEKALPENFGLEHKNVTIEMITVSGNYNITFLMHEKKRKTTVKKFDNKGNIIEP